MPRTNESDTHVHRWNIYAISAMTIGRATMSYTFRCYCGAVHIEERAR